MDTPPTDRPLSLEMGSGLLRATLDHLHEGLQVISPDWRYLYVNEVVCRQARRRREELLGHRMSDVYPGIEQTAMFRRLETCMRERRPDAMENEFSFPDGSTSWFELRFAPVPDGVLVMSLDIGDRKAVEEQLRHSQKMEALGRLAGKVAHDLNNLLTAVLGFGHVARDSLPADDPAHRHLSQVLTAADRAEILVRQLLAFSRKRRDSPRVVDVNRLVTGLHELLDRILGEGVELLTRPAAEPCWARLDPGAFEQVLVNLAVNARDAMPGGGQLTIETSYVTLDQSHRMTRGGTVRPGDYVALAVSDTGHGIDPKAQSMMFEPFFTTKPEGVGTGLGLAICFGIVKQAGGYIWVYSEVGEGTTFKLYLPRATEATQAAATERPALLPTGVESVLLVEDDEQVRSLTQHVLTTCGYQVVPTDSGAAALAAAEAARRPPDLLLTDVVMPEMSGRELAKRMRQRCPGLKVIFMSGYTGDALQRRGFVGARDHVLQKPFTPGDLAAKVRSVLEA